MNKFIWTSRIVSFILIFLFFLFNVVYTLMLKTSEPTDTWMVLGTNNVIYISFSLTIAWIVFNVMFMLIKFKKANLEIALWLTLVTIFAFLCGFTNHIYIQLGQNLQILIMVLSLSIFIGCTMLLTLKIFKKPTAKQ